MRRNIMCTRDNTNLNVNSEKTITMLQQNNSSDPAVVPNNQSSATGTGQEWLSKTNLFSDGGTTNEHQQVGASGPNSGGKHKGSSNFQ